MTRMIEVAEESGAVGLAFLCTYLALSTSREFNNNPTDKTQRPKTTNELFVLEESLVCGQNAIQI